jgi:5-methylcytosine-specific restriction endonuclease McrA
MKAKKVVKSRVVKTRAGGTMSEAMYWTFIRSALRQKSRWWPPITQAKLEARRIYKGVNKRQKYEYQCAHCKDWFMEKDINVDHIISAGALNCGADLEGFVGRLFCEKDNLQVLCEVCHNIKTQKDRK